MNFRRLISFVLLLNAFSRVPNASGAQESSASILVHGVIRTTSGAEVPGANVSLLNAQHGVEATASTGTNGAYALRVPEAANYRIQVRVHNILVSDETVPASALSGATLNLSIKSEEAMSDSALLHPEATVEVTATRTPEELLTSASSVSVVSRAELQARNVQTLDEGLDQVPGLYVQRIQGLADTEASVYLRGFNGPNRTLVLLDGQPINDSFFGTVPWNVIPVDEIQSVEVVRGPFSSLYGGDALGGVIDIRTRQPGSRSFDIGEEYGSNATDRLLAHYGEGFKKAGVVLGYEHLKFGGYENAPIEGYLYSGTGTPVTGGQVTTDPYGNPVVVIGSGGRNWLKQDTYRGAFNYSFTQATRIAVQYIRESYTFGHGPYTTYLRNSAGNSVDNGTFQVSTPHGLQAFDVDPGAFLQYPGAQQTNFLSVSFIHAFDDKSALRIDAGYNQIPSSNYTAPDFVAATLTGGPGVYTDTNADNFHLNAQYVRNVRNNLFTFGDEVRHDEAKNANYTLADWLMPNARGAQKYLAYGQSANEAAYAQDEVTLFSRLRLVAGGRYEYWKTYDGVINDYSSPTSLTPYAARSDNFRSGKVGGSYSLPGGFVLRASVGTSFRNPDIYELYATSDEGGITYAANPKLNAEHVRSWEAGLRKSFQWGTNLDIDFFQNNISNIIYREADLAVDPTGNYLINVNAAQGRTRGAEISLQQRILSWLTFRPSYTYTEAVITQNPDDPSIVDKYVPNIPKQMIAGELLAAKKRWTGAVTARYVSATFETDNNIDTIRGVPGAYDPFFLLGANLTYQITPHFELSGTGTNLLDRRYYQYYLAAGRQAYVGIRFRY